MPEKKISTIPLLNMAIFKQHETNLWIQAERIVRTQGGYN